uniref:Uncharacterized protein n=1 Tax=Tetradesmus obliquus TaxID=3088 RepID=A0A383VXY8_TETOB
MPSIIAVIAAARGGTLTSAAGQWWQALGSIWLPQPVGNSHQQCSSRLAIQAAAAAAAAASCLAARQLLLSATSSHCGS